MTNARRSKNAKLRLMPSKSNESLNKLVYAHKAQFHPLCLD
jgi:hypothetical protein